MNTYHKIQSLYKRNSQGKIIVGMYSMPEFAYLANIPWLFTEKIDGTNIRLVWDGTKLTIKGKTDNAQLPAKLVENIQDRYDFAGVFGNMPVCLYGEGYGAGIQKGGSYRKDQGFILFDVKISDWWLKRDDVVDIAYKLDMDYAPVIGEGTLFYLHETVSKGFTSLVAEEYMIAEGIVARPKVDLYARNGARIITKLKYKDFL